MSQPKRYDLFVDTELKVQKGGEWVQYSDYAALVQQGIRDHQDWRSKLNFLEADYKAEIARLRAEKEAETRATFDAIRTITQLRDDYAALAAENERLKKQIHENGLDVHLAECRANGSEEELIYVRDANARLTAEVEWLRKADRLVCWNPTTQQWEVRHEAIK